MRIVVNNVAASGGGALTILKNLEEEIVRLNLNKEHEWIFLLSDNYLDNNDNISVIKRKELKTSRLKRILFDYFFGGKIINSFNPDLYISLNNTATLGVNTHQIVYLHQLLPFQKEKNFSFFKSNERLLAFYQKVIGFFIKDTLSRTDADVVVQTEYFKKLVEKELSNNLIVIRPKVTHFLKHQYNSENIRTFFYPASNWLYKNHQVIYDAVGLLEKKGITDFKIILTIEKPDFYFNQQIYKFVGNLPYVEVLNYYGKSVLLFPSYIETYGLPLAEARQAGTRIICSRTGFSQEILRGYENVKMFEKYNAKELADLIELQINGKLILNTNDSVYSENLTFGEFLQKFLVGLN
ncbi:glycosyltransferase [Enterococcus italicus]|uniref:glycosyltransferase n=1 Tax=Enterococcus italicus TaxID=246144 RepID=UPI003F445556